ncbi:MAG: ATP-binding protein [Thermoplasmata archaeon]|nr:ATP-binding protein [Thermoplasmata archaeon]
MMLRRKMFDQLKKWKSRSHKSLLIKGQRQVGKTYIIREFAKSEYDDYIEINFSKDKSIFKVFEGDLDVDVIINNISIVKNKEIVPGKTLLFFDEIQECMEAWASLKFFTIDGRYDVIASGSLLGVTIPHKNKSEIEPLLPVGYQEQFTMYSLDFEEFLWANGVSEKTIDILRNNIRNKEPINDIIYEKIRGLFKSFMIVGGMPESVDRFVNTGKYSESFNVMDTILAVSRNDMLRYNSGVNRVKTLECFDAIPSNLSQSNKRFMYSRIDGGGSRNSAEKYMGNILWIRDAGVANICYSLYQPSLPLKGNEIRDVFRLYLSDTGLLLHMFGPGAVEAVNDWNTSYNMGAITENIISECLVKCGFDLHYYRKNSGPDKMELDFVIETPAGCTVIEVKSGKDRTAPSINKVSKFHEIDEKIVFEDSNISADESGMLHLPFFVAAFMKEIYHNMENSLFR